MRGTLSRGEMTELWARWRGGESVAAIARAMRQPYSRVHRDLITRGGVPPSERRRRRSSLTAMERGEIAVHLACNHSIREIARRLGRCASSISREVVRNGGQENYSAIAAEERAWKTALRPKECRLASRARLRRVVAEKLARNWAPQQVAAWLKKNFADDEEMHISHETIYRSLFMQARGVLKKDLQAHLRSHRLMRRPKAAAQRVDARGVRDFIPISERPAEAEDRAVPGHWEGDLLVGSLGNCIATLVERRSRFVMLVKVDKNDTATVIEALRKQIVKLPAELRKSLTWDRGTEIRRHKELSIAADIKIYVCDPQSPWQRGTNENTNGLLRQYFPKGVSVSGYSQKQLNAIARELNERPRKTLDYDSPAKVYATALQ